MPNAAPMMSWRLAKRKRKGYGSWEWVYDPEIRFAISDGNLLGPTREKVLDYAIQAED